MGRGSRSRGGIAKDATMQGYSNALARAVKNAAQAEIARLEAIEPEEPTTEGEPIM